MTSYGTIATSTWQAVQASDGCCNKVHKSSGLKQHKFILFQFRGQNQSHEAKLGYPGMGRVWSLLEALRENPFPHGFQHPVAWPSALPDSWPLPPASKDISATSASIVASINSDPPASYLKGSS